MATSSRRAPVAAREAILRIRVAPAQLARWRTVADREYRSLSELAREAIEARVDRTLRGSPGRDKHRRAGAPERGGRGTPARSVGSRRP